ncbi:MAG: 2-oxoacid:acceptor oxidoreductase subunit alpha [Marinilabiliaceae bacterium]|nr:2-oxoacid:acceptor oxidoreductase subunit alpha [Marinilabiliaceae bacterium]
MTINKEKLTVRFSGDSGDGMQLTGTLFSQTSAMYGNAISTFPDYPADIRAPQGTIGGVSGFQINFGHSNILTPGDYIDVLIAMNPAALKTGAQWMSPGGTIIYDEDNFDAKSLQKAGYETDDPIVEDQLEKYKIIKIPVGLLARESVKVMEVDNKTVLRSKNMFILGFACWLFNRPLDPIMAFLNKKFEKKKVIRDVNLTLFEAGFWYGNSIRDEVPQYYVAPAPVKKGFYRNLHGNKATAWGFLYAAEKSGLSLFLGSYPITPATEILQELSERKDLGVKVFQAEDEIAGICTAIGASFAGHLGITTTSGPGLALKGEAIGLAVMAELPLVVVNVQRGGPSTGLPTKTEQADLLQALYGRNGESPAAVIAASTPVNCFDFAYIASKIAVEHTIPVILLTDGFLANGTQIWKLPEEGDFPTIKIPKTKQNAEEFLPYLRDPEKLNRDWVAPGTPGFRHRIGSLEKTDQIGTISHDAQNHEKMVKLRQEKLDRIVNYIPELEVEGDPEADTLAIGWGGTYGHLFTAVSELNKEGKKIALAHFNYINPLPKNTKDILEKYQKIIVCELNLGQFASYLKMKHPEFHYHQYNKIQGQPFIVQELKDAFIKLIEA